MSEYSYKRKPAKYGSVKSYLNVNEKLSEAGSVVGGVSNPPPQADNARRRNKIENICFIIETAMQ